MVLMIPGLSMKMDLKLPCFKEQYHIYFWNQCLFCKIWDHAPSSSAVSIPACKVIAFQRAKRYIQICWKGFTRDNYINHNSIFWKIKNQFFKLVQISMWTLRCYMRNSGFSLGLFFNQITESWTTHYHMWDRYCYQTKYKINIHHKHLDPK